MLATVFPANFLTSFLVRTQLCGAYRRAIAAPTIAPAFDASCVTPGYMLRNAHPDESSGQAADWSSRVRVVEQRHDWTCGDKRSQSRLGQNSDVGKRSKRPACEVFRALVAAEENRNIRVPKTLALHFSHRGLHLFFGRENSQNDRVCHR